MSDTHLGSVHEQSTALRRFYKMASDAGCEFAIHAGDLTDGGQMRRGHEYECHVNGIDNLIEYVVDNYPSDIPTYVLGGNHDESFMRLAGLDVLSQISKERSDLRYLGLHQATLSMDGRKIAVFHGAGVGATSNRLIRTYSESCKSGPPPDLVINGHLHSVCIIPFYGENDSMLIQAGCFKGTGDYERRLMLKPQIVGIILSRPERGVWQPRICRFKEKKRDFRAGDR